ncbi:MAG: CHAP domain-containing protein [Candidatus Staskawiczbacteria bacterium]|nr:CHAP domain-containing protein [Candidatus Staskawiczbacteria bacterium]
MGKVLRKMIVAAFALIFALQPIAPALATTYTYDYNNRLTSATNTSTGAVTTYSYDPQGQRIKMVVQNSDGSSETTYYPSKDYSVSYTTDSKGNKSPEKITKYVNANGTLVATISGTGQTAVLQPVLTDHQGSITNVLSIDNKPAETIDYFPFGQIRLDNTATGQNPQQKKFLGQDFDSSTGLDYLNARYYNSSIAKFLSEDPVSRDNPEKFLADPQQLNLYSYAQNNPITLSDPSGKKVSEIQPYLPLGGIYGYSYGEAIASYRGVNVNSRGEYGPLDENNFQQCTTFVQKFYKAQYDINISGIGKEGAINYGNQKEVNRVMENNKNSGSMAVYKNGSSVLPQENDLMTWTSDDQSYGHVGTIVEVVANAYNNGGTIYTLEQNARPDKALFAQNFTQNKDGGYTVSDRSKNSPIHVDSWTRYSSQQSIPATFNWPGLGALQPKKSISK